MPTLGLGMHLKCSSALLESSESMVLLPKLVVVVARDVSVEQLTICSHSLLAFKILASCSDVRRETLEPGGGQSVTEGKCVCKETATAASIVVEMSASACWPPI